MPRKLNVALLGYGFVGKVFHAPLLAHTPGYTLHTVVSSDAGKVHADFPQIRVLADAFTAFADPAIDLVVIATPNASHAPLALAALQAGKHVVVDKPFTLTMNEADAVIQAARQAKRLVSVFQNRRWDADFLTVQQLLADGTLGEISEFHSHFDRFRPQVVDRWRERDEPGAGLWYDLGPHLIDQALQLFGPPEALFVDIAKQRQGAQSADYFHALLRYPRLRVILHAGALVADSRRRFAVHGSRGSYVKHGLDAQEDALRAGKIPGSAGWGVDSADSYLLLMQEGTARKQAHPCLPGDYRQFYAQMHQAIEQGDSPPVSPVQALVVMRMIELGLQSAAERQEVIC